MLSPLEAERLGSTVDMSADEVLELCDSGNLPPGLDALESLGTRCCESACDVGSAPVGTSDIANRFRSARRVLNNVSDRYLYDLNFPWGSDS